MEVGPQEVRAFNRSSSGFIEVGRGAVSDGEGGG